MDEFLLLERNVFDFLNITEYQLINWLDDNKHIILVCKEDNKIIGFTIMELYGENNKNCFIRDVGVDKSKRGRGIGKALLLNGLGKAKKKGA